MVPIESPSGSRGPLDADMDANYSTSASDNENGVFSNSIDKNLTTAEDIAPLAGIELVYDDEHSCSYADVVGSRNSAVEAQSHSHSGVDAAPLSRTGESVPDGEKYEDGYASPKKYARATPSQTPLPALESSPKFFADWFLELTEDEQDLQSAVADKVSLLRWSEMDEEGLGDIPSGCVKAELNKEDVSKPVNSAVAMSFDTLMDRLRKDLSPNSQEVLNLHAAAL